MRIWIVHQDAIPPIVMGPTRHFDLAKKWIEKGHDVTILAGNYCHNNSLYIAEPYSLTKKIAYYSKVPFIWFPVPTYKKNSFRRVFGMITFAYKLLMCKQFKFMPKPDVVIGSSPSPLAAFAAYKLAKRFNASFVYEIRDLWPATLLSLGKFKKYHPLILFFGYIEKKLLLEANQILTVLPGVNEYISSRGINVKKLIFFPNAVDIKNIKYRSSTRQCNFNIVYAGSFNIANDLDTLLQAAKILQNYPEKNFRIKLIGDGPQKARLKEIVLAQNLTGVEFISTVRKECIHELLAEADVCVGLVMKSNLYQYGTSLNKITDYLAIARPVVFALDSPYSPITEANAGFTTEPENPQMLADAFLKLASLSYEERQEIGLNGRKYAEKFYDMDKMANELIDLLAK